MTFLHPLILASGLGAVSIPILIHLLMRRRRKPVLWGAMRFLLEAYRKHSRRLRLEQLLLLATRCLLVAMLALGLARPTPDAEGFLGQGGGTTVYLLVDTGLASSATRDGGGAALEKHKTTARSILSSLDAGRGDRAGLIAMDAPARALVTPASADLAGVRDLLDGLEASDSMTDVAGAAALMREVLAGLSTAERAGTRVIVLSEFLAGSVRTTRELPSVGEGVRVLASSPASAGADNVTVVSVEPLRSIVLGGSGLGEDQVMVTLGRSGPWTGNAGVTRVTLRVEGTKGDVLGSGAAIARWSPGQSETVVSATLSLSTPAGFAGSPAMMVARLEADAIGGDSVYRRPIEFRDSLRVGVVFERRFTESSGITSFAQPDWIRLALDPGASLVEWQDRHAGAAIEPVAIDPGSVDPPHLGGLAGVMVARPELLGSEGWRVLRHFADAGGLVVVFPTPDTVSQAWGGVFEAAFELGWTIEGEAREVDSRPAWTPEAARVFSLLEGEFGELARAVGVTRVLPVSAPPTGVLLTLNDPARTPWVLAGRPGARGEEGGSRGLVVMVTTALAFSWTDLPAKPLLVPLVQELVRQGAGRASGESTLVAGSSPSFPPRVVELVGEDGRRVGLEGGRAGDPIRKGGVWRAIDARGGVDRLVGVNADPEAGAGDPTSPDEVRAWLASLSGVAPEWLEGSGRTSAAREGALQGSDRLALALLAAALGFAVLEVMLARWFSHARVSLASEEAS